MKKYIKNIFFILGIFYTIFMLATPCYAGKYDKELSKSQRDSLCQQLKSQRDTANKLGGKSLGGGIIPDNVLISIYNTTKNISDKVALLLTMGHSLTCHAVHAGKNEVDALGIKLFDYPDFSVWICGAIIYMVGFMMTLSIAFYVADIAFKLGFAIIMLPIGIALWPFPITKDRLAILISIILRNAAIFLFLAITVSYALNLIDAALNTEMADEVAEDSPLVAALKSVFTSQQNKISWNEASGIQKLFFLVNNNMTDLIAKNFTLFSSYFLVILFALIYGFKLVGATIPDYVDKFFPDKAFGGGMRASPIHNMMTQGMDFVKKNTVDKAASWAGDVVKTQTGRAIAGVGNLVSGKYNGQIKNYWKNPGNITQGIANKVHDVGASAAKGASSVLTGTLGRVVLGKQASQDLQNSLNEKIDKRAGYLDEKAANVAQNINNAAHERQAQRQQRRDELKEQFNNSEIGKGLNQARSNVNNLHNRAQNAFNDKIDAIHEKRADIDAQVKDVNKEISDFREKALTSIDNFENKVIQKRNTRREKINNWSKAYQAVDNLLAKKEDDKKIVKGIKSAAGFVMKAPIALVDGAHRVTNGAVTLTLNTATVALGSVAKSAVRVGTGIAEAPAKTVGAVAKTPGFIAEGVLKTVNVTKNVQNATNAVKSGIRLTGEVLSKTGEQMQQNYKSDAEIAQEEAEKQARWDKEEKERRERGEEY